MIRTLFSILLLFGSVAVFAQGMSDEMKQQEEALYASTKQLNQFFRRFNGEEDEKGNRYYPKDKKYRDEGLRKKYLPILFNYETGDISEKLARNFVKDMVDKSDPVFLGLRSENYYAEVTAVFDYKGKKTSLLLFMEIQPQRDGYEWVITDVSFDEYTRYFDKDTTGSKPFIHPMSHELEFMNLKKAFSNGPAESYTPDGFEPDFLTLFLYDVNKGNLVFRTIRNVRFHFFGVKDWYFEISKFNRTGNNTGWLISNLVKVNAMEKRQLKQYIFGK